MPDMSKRRYSQLSASIIDACKKGDVETVTALLVRGANVNTDSVHHKRSPYFVSDPLLHKAVRYGHVGIVQVLLAHGARVNVRNCVYETALHASPSVEISELLITHSASVNAIDAYNRTPLHMAASFGALDILQILLKNGAKLDIQTASGCTSLHNACHCFQKDSDLVVQELINRGANVNAKNMHGETPLHTAAKSGKCDTVTILLENGANFDAKNNRGQTPIMTTLHKLVTGFKRNGYCKPSELVATVKILADVGSYLEYSETEDMVVGGPVRPRESAIEEWQRVEIRHRLIRFLIQVGCGTQTKISEKVLFILVDGKHFETFQLLQDCGYTIQEPLLEEICATVRHGDEVLQKVHTVVSEPPNLQCLCRMAIRRSLGEALVYRSKGRMVKVFTRIRDYVLRKTANFIRLSSPRRIVATSDVDLLPLPESVKDFLSFGGLQELTELKEQLEGRNDLPQIYLGDDNM